MHKNEEHMENLRRSKSYIADSYFSPFTLKSGNLKEMFEDKQAWKQDRESEEYGEWKEALIEMVPKLNYDAVIELALYLSFEARLNDQSIWKSIESAALENIHLYTLKDSC